MFHITYITEEETNTFDREKIYVYLTEVVDEVEKDVIKPTYLVDLLLHKEKENSVIITNQIFKFENDTEETLERTYRLRMWVDASTNVITNEDGSQSINIEGGTYEYKVHVETADEIINLYYLIESKSVLDNLNSAYVNTTNGGIDFSLSTSVTDNNGNFINGKGIYELNTTSMEEYPVYYYRGAVDDNNVLFANFCWHIVRTTETGGIKLIYNGMPTDGTCDNTGTASVLSSKSVFNNSYGSLAYSGYKYGKAYDVSALLYDIVGPTYLYGNDVEYSNGKYKLIDPTSYTFDSSTKTTLNNYHYTCLTTTDTCTSVYYVYYAGDDFIYYVTLTDGKTIEKAIDEMLYNSSNENKSTILSNIETWYKKNMTDFTEGLENEIWCSDRSIYTLGGFNPDGGSVTSSLRFNGNYRLDKDIPSLECSNNNDRFTLKVESGGIKGYGNNTLDYPVGLLTSDEANYAGEASYLDIEQQQYWLLSPASFYQYFVLVNRFGENSKLSTAGVNGSLYVRPSVSLYKNTLINGGMGTVDNPYIIK